MHTKKAGAMCGAGPHNRYAAIVILVFIAVQIIVCYGDFPSYWGGCGLGVAFALRNSSNCNRTTGGCYRILWDTLILGNIRVKNG